ncbi:SAM-dependent methyltransferase [Nocardioides marmoribigeumensis]|uniref:SAM-dependent methyltransferase n=1 Tax=Nocardioides marmoribigeumensis TaxID=433649 RepID=A0ABU2BYK4_9ACTN|nr:class I SAM-dependent methyltransferase [Nocardioides marmoribigeumensis]MDR7363485.1 SAM-dependent methyltransferase [Nocardioides marmoribigeumensis]
MDHTFDSDYWDRIWSGDRATAMRSSAPNPHLLAQAADLAPGSALDAGCGGGAEAIWLASRGWTVTAADIARTALDFGRERAATAGLGARVEWVQADLSTWQPEATYDLVTTHYAHPAIPQLEFYGRIATWVAPGGTLLIVGHLHPGQHDHTHRDEGHPPAEASATAAAITALLEPATWDVVTAEESQRTMTGPGGRERTIHDVVVRATRRP